MTSEYLRDGLFLLAWFGLMTGVWLGWAQEGPPEKARLYLGAGSVLGLLAAIGGAFLVARYWESASALDGRYAVFGIIVAVEVVAAGIACFVLARRGRARWSALAVALVVSLHFLPLAWLLADWGLAVLAVLEVALVIAAGRLAARRELTPSYPVGATMGSTMLASASVAAVRWLPEAIAG